MPIADASLTSLRFVKETTYGTTPAGAWNEVRMVSESLGQDKEVVQSDEIAADRRPPDNIQVGSAGSGDIVSEVIGGGFNVAGGQPYPDQFFLGCLGQATAFTTTAADQGFATGTFAMANVGGNSDRITMTHSATSFAGGFAAGQYVQVKGLTTDSALASLTYLNSVYLIISVSTTVITLSKGPRVVGTPTTGNLATVGTVTFRRIPDQNDSTSFQSFSFERMYSIASEFARLPGYAFQGFRFEMAPKRPMRITWNLLGQGEISATTTASGSVVAAPTGKSFAPVADFKSLSIGEDGHSFSFTGFTLDVKGGLYPQDEEAGVLGPQGVGLGTFDVTGSVEFYYEGGSLHTFYQQFVDKSIHFAVSNVAGDALLFAMPRCNFINPGRRSVPGKDQAIKGSLAFRAAKGTEVVGGATYLLKIGRI